MHDGHSPMTSSCPFPWLARIYLSSLSSCFLLTSCILAAVVILCLLITESLVSLPQSLRTCYSHCLGGFSLYAASFLSCSSFQHFNRFHPSSNDISLASTPSEVAIFLCPFVSFHLSTCKMILLISSFTRLFFSLDESCMKACLSRLLPYT